MGIYGGFAGLYDSLIEGAPPAKWVSYVESIWREHGAKPNLVLDLACGTGRITSLLAKKGYDMIGVDSSVEMLSRAAKKAGGKDILYLRQDMRELELYGTVDAVICLCDSVNYILLDNELQTVFNLVYNYLNNGGIFIFDINTEYKFSHVLGDGVFAGTTKSGAYIWENCYDGNKRINEYFVTFFAKKRKTELYERFEECHYERAYSEGDIETALSRAGLDVLAKYGEFTKQPPKNDSERIFFVVRKGSD